MMRTGFEAHFICKTVDLTKEQNSKVKPKLLMKTFLDWFMSHT